MRLRTDDDIYRARLVYLGPPGYTLPVHLPYAQYGLFMLLVPLYMFIHWLFTLTVDLFPAWEIALAIVTTSFIFRHVDPDRPARMVIRTALTDWRAHPGAGDRAARSAPGRQPDQDPGGAGMTGRTPSVRRRTRATVCRQSPRRSHEPHFHAGLPGRPLRARRPVTVRTRSTTPRTRTRSPSTPRW